MLVEGAELLEKRGRKPDQLFRQAEPSDKVTVQVIVLWTLIISG